MASSRAAQQPVDDGRLSRFAARCEQILPRRFGLLATLFVALGALGLGTVKGGHVDDVVTTLADARDAVANAAGFRIANLAITGRKQLTQEEILAIGGITGRSSLLFLDPGAVRDRLLASPWIAEATVFKLYPDQLRIDIKERAPFALWQKDGKVTVISEDGRILENFLPRRFTSLPLVVGVGAETHARDFLALLAKHKEIMAQTRAVILVGERRWNLRLKNGLDIRLPETGIETALQRLVKLDRDDKILSRDITVIDLRLADRITVRLSEEAAKARSDALKTKKTRAGHA